MIEQRGTVIRMEDGQAWIQVGPQSGCSACDAGKGCGAGVFGRLLKRQPVEFALPGQPGMMAGEVVSVGIPEAGYLGLVWRLYGFPLIAALAGGALAWSLSGPMGPAWQDTFTGLLALLAGGLALKMSRRGAVKGVQGLPLVLLPGTPSVAGCARNTESIEPAP